MAITQLASLSRLPEELRGRMLEEVMRRLFKGGDLTAFGLMNAVTSLARDTQDPDTRWRLEELGGGLAVARWSPPPVRTAPAAEALPFARAGNARELELVG